MKIAPILTLLSCLMLLAALAAGAYEFQPIGYESIGMGGAGVANAKGSYAGYYNPALLAKSRYTLEGSLSVGLGVREFNLAENIDRLSALDLTNAINRIAANAPTNGSNGADATNVLEAQDILRGMSGGKNGLFLMPSAGLGFQISNLSVAVFGTSDASAKAVIDPNKLDIIVATGNPLLPYVAYDPATDSYSATYNGAAIDQDVYEANSLEFALQNQDTYIDLNGLALVEVPISTARTFNIGLGKLSIGGSAKYMSGTTYASRINIDTNSEDIQDQLDDSQKTSTAFGLDAGVLYQPPLLNNLTFGLVGKNLNKPKFKMADGSLTDLPVEPMYRAGVAMGLFHNKIDFAADYDISKNKLADGTDSQYLGGGINLHPTSWFSLRAGAMQNQANKEQEGLVYTAGLGIGIKFLQLDVAAAMSSKKGSYKGNEIPRYSKVNVALVSRW